MLKETEIIVSKNGGLILKNFILLDERERNIVYKWRNDPRVAEKMRTRFFSYEEHIKFINSLKTETKSFYWLVYCESAPCGVISLSDIKDECAQLGIYTDPDKKGLGNLFMDALFYAAFMILKLKKISAHVYKSNAKAIGLYERMGMSLAHTCAEMFIYEIKSSHFEEIYDKNI